MQTCKHANMQTCKHATSSASQSRLPMCRRGFTLIELSIVLVIIGLIVGGVLVGRDLIESAEMRQTVNIARDVGTAINTFKIKYNCIPGDCAFSTFSSGQADGNANQTIDGSEFLEVGNHLLAAGLLPDGLEVNGLYLATNKGIISVDGGDNGAFIAFSVTQSMSFLHPPILGFYLNSGEKDIPTLRNLDRKYDDGNAHTGRIQAWADDPDDPGGCIDINGEYRDIFSSSVECTFWISSVI